MKLLLTTDLSEASIVALRFIKDFAKNRDCSIHVICVLEDVSATNSPYTLASAVIDASGIMEQSRQQAATRLKELCSSNLAGLSFTEEVLTSKTSVAETILSAAKEKKVELVVMASQGRSGLKKVLLGSTAEKVLRQSRIPVLLVPFNVEQASE